MTISPSLIPSYLNKSRNAIDVHLPGGQLALGRLSQQQILVLSGRSYIEAEINKHGYLRYCRLLVSVKRAKQALGLLGGRNRQALCAEDNYTVFIDGRTYTHNKQRSYAYAR